MKIGSLVCGCLAMALATMGCAHKDDMKTAALPTEEATPTPVATLETTEVATRTPVTAAQDTTLHYSVRKGDSLWTIASQQGILGDSMQWPLLFRQNRDQIQDPDLIQVGEDLTYGASMSAQQVASAQQEAKDTPPYAPHTDVRKSLPLQY